MKKLSYLLLPVFFVFFSQDNVTAQVPAEVVTDPGVYAHLAEGLQAAAQTNASLDKQVSLLKDAKKAYEKVSDGIRELNLIDRIISEQSSLIQRTKDSYASLEKSNLFTASELNLILYSFTDITSQSQQTLMLANQIAKDDIFKMSDFERLQFLTDLLNKSSQANASVYMLSYKYDRIRQKKLVAKIFGN